MGKLFRVLLYIFICFSFTQVVLAKDITGPDSATSTDELPADTSDYDTIPRDTTTGPSSADYANMYGSQMQATCEPHQIAAGAGTSFRCIDKCEKGSSYQALSGRGNMGCVSIRRPTSEPEPDLNNDTQESIDPATDCFNKGGTFITDEDGGSCEEKPKSVDTRDFLIKDIFDACNTETEQAAECCSPDIANSNCLSPQKKGIINQLQQISQIVQQFKSSSIAGSCSSTKDAARMTKLVIAAAGAMCSKHVGICTNQCRPCRYQCELDQNGKLVEPKCEEWKTSMRWAVATCSGYVALKSATAYVEVKAMNELEKKSAECGEQVATNEACLDEEAALNYPTCNLLEICKKEEHRGKPQCKPYIDIASDDDDPIVFQADGGGLDDASNGPGSDGYGDGEMDCDPEQEDCFGDETGFEALAKSDDGEGTSGGSAGNSGSPVSAGGIGGGGGSGGGGGGKSAGKDRNILKGTSSGNGYISRFRGSGGGGGYKNSVRRASGGSGGGRSISSFNLKKYLPKSKRITKGSFKNYHRLPSGQLMAPQSIDIFNLHHRAYKNACLKNKAVKGCDPKNRKKLGSKQTLSQLRDSYRSQLFLPKELNAQKANLSNIKIKSVKSEVRKNARITYYQMQYMKKNKIRSLPFNSSSQTIGRMRPNLASKEAQALQKMQSWVNAKVQTLPTNRATNKKTVPSKRMPASVGK